MSSHSKIPTPFRVLAPGGGFSSPSTILRTREKIRKEQEAVTGQSNFEIAKNHLEQSLSSATSGCVVQSSGTQSLYEIFRHLCKEAESPIVGIPAYTCPDIAVAAVTAGCRVLPLEIDTKTLDIASSQAKVAAAHAVSALVLPNLFGLVDSLNPWQGRSDLLLIDDACQAGLSYREGIRVGCREGTWGVVSFGRGKALSGVGGGAVIAPSKDSDLLRARSASVESSLVSMMYGSALWLAERPSLYGIPARIPGLGLGETHCDLDFQKTEISEVALLHAIAQLAKEEQLQELYRTKAQQYEEQLSELALRTAGLELPAQARASSKEATLLRYPIILPTAELRDALYQQLWEYGASRSYPSTLFDYPELQPSLIDNPVPQAGSVSRRILSLPLHIYVARSDVAYIAQAIKKALNP